MPRRRFKLAHRIGRDVCRHWQGRLTLAASFWIHGVGINVLLALGLFELALWMRDSTLSCITALGRAAQALICVVSVWQWVGVWRASGRRKTHFFARLLARACVLASVVHVAVGIVQFTTQWRSLTPHGPYLVRVLGKPDEAELRGPLSDGVSTAMAELLQGHPSVRTLHITSPGGLVNEGLRLAELVRTRRLRVVVDSSCASACTLVLLASSERIMRPAAAIGFHRMHVIGGRDVIPVHDDAASALSAVGASEEFIASVRATA